jgi:hypothetical protein
MPRSICATAAPLAQRPPAAALHAESLLALAELPEAGRWMYGADADVAGAEARRGACWACRPAVLRKGVAAQLAALRGWCGDAAGTVVVHRKVIWRWTRPTRWRR